MLKIDISSRVYYVSGLCLILSACNQELKFFEGVIHYKHTVESCNSDYPYDYLLLTVGKASTYYYKNGNYKWIIPDAALGEELYLDGDDRYFLLIGGQDVIYGESQYQDEDILESSIKKSQVKILGYDCDILSLVTRNRASGSALYRDIYFSPEIRIESSAFTRLRYLSHDFIASKTHSLPLMIVMRNENFEITWSAVDVEFKALNDSVFHIPGMEHARPLLSSEED